MNVRTRGVALLVVVTVIWGTTFPFVKTLGETLPAEAIVAVRFLIAAVVMSPWLRHIDRTRLIHGALIGVVGFASYATQTVGLHTVSSGRAAFVTGLNVVMVPLAFPLLGRPLPKVALLSALVAVVGIAIMSWDDGALRFAIGDAWVLVCAVAYAAYVLLLERFAHQHGVLELTAVQVMTVGICGAVWVLLGNRTKVFDSLGAADLGTWGTLLYLGIVAVAITTILQTQAQRVVSAAVAAVVYALEPVFGALASFVWRGERLAPLGFVGAALIIAAMLLAQLGPVEPHPHTG